MQWSSGTQPWRSINASAAVSVFGSKPGNARIARSSDANTRAPSISATYNGFLPRQSRARHSVRSRRSHNPNANMPASSGSAASMPGASNAASITSVSLCPRKR